jgi:hypothetical protein
MRIALRNYCLAGILGVLAVVHFGGGREDGPTREIVRLLPRLVPAEAVALELRSPRGIVRVRREGDTWVLPELFDYPAEPTLVRRLLERLGDLTTLDLLSQDPARHADYGLTEDIAQRLLIFAAEAPVADVLIARGSDGSAYVRRVGEDAVYGVRVLPVTPTEAFAWHHVAPLTGLEREHLQQLEIRGAAYGVDLVVRRNPARPADGWTDGDGRPIAGDGGYRLVDEALRLTPTAVLAGTPAPEHGLDPAPLRLRFVGVDGEAREVLLGSPSVGELPVSGVIPAQGPNGPWVVGVPAGAVDRLLGRARAIRAR